MNRQFDLPERPRILVITLRRLGDVLLTTPLIRTLRHAHAGATLDVLVFRGSEGILAGNPDIDHVLTVAERPAFGDTLRTLLRLRRRYDLVVSTQAGDRPTFLSLAAGSRRVGLVPERGSGAWWKRRVLHRPVPARRREHRVETLLRLSDALGLARVPEVIGPQGVRPSGTAQVKQPYAVIHAHPVYRYKRWHEAGWRALADALMARGLSVVATGGPDPAERAYLDALWDGLPAVARLDGRLGWPALAALLKEAAVYVGPDTSVTHLAAAAGCPAVALFGPTDPREWGLWPAGGLDTPWEAAAGIQRRGNVWLVQNPLPCTPCQEEGCERRLESPSVCLDRLETARVLEAVDRALAHDPEKWEPVFGKDDAPTKR